MPVRILVGAFAIILAPIFSSAVLAASEYEIGGPLAGLKLPLFATQHNERPGYPGNLPGKYDDDFLAPELELYPGSVEHYRAYMFKYMPIRSFFDQQSLLKNWIAPDIPGYKRGSYYQGLPRDDRGKDKTYCHTTPCGTSSSTSELEKDGPVVPQENGNTGNAQRLNLEMQNIMT